jgi:hypothetical protein
LPTIVSTTIKGGPVRSPFLIPMVPDDSEERLKAVGGRDTARL